jgi:hypothetical protein
MLSELRALIKNPELNDAADLVDALHDWRDTCVCLEKFRPHVCSNLDLFLGTVALTTTTLEMDLQQLEMSIAGCQAEKFLYLTSLISLYLDETESALKSIQGLKTPVPSKLKRYAKRLLK